MSSIVTLALKDLRLLWRSKADLFWVIGFPLVMAILFGAIYSGMSSGSSGAMTIIIVDEDRSDRSRQLIAALDKSDAITVRTSAREEPYDKGSGFDQVRQGNVTACIVLPPGYGESAGLPWLAQTSVIMGIDPSRQASGAYLQGLLTAASFELMRDRFMDKADMRRQVAAARAEVQNANDMDPVQRMILTGFLGALDTFIKAVDLEAVGVDSQFEPAPIESVAVARASDRPTSSFEISFPSAILWGLIGCAATFAISIVRERQRGTLYRLRVAPIGHAQIVAGKGLACFVACCVATSLILLVGHFAFGVRLDKPLLLVAAVGCSAISVVGITMAMSVIGKTEQAVAGAGWGIMMVLAMFGGGMVPLLFMPGWMRPLSHFSPFKWSVLAIEGAIWRDFTPLEMLWPCAVLVGVGAIGYVVGVTILARAKA